MPPIIQNIIIIVVLVCLIGAACCYIYKEKKRGTKCIGCSMAGNCAKARAKKELESCACKKES